MTLTMYDASVPVFVRMLGNLSKLLAKGAASFEARKIDPSVLVNARLAPDMHPLSRQIQIASDSAKGCGARLAGVEPPSFPDTESTIAELQARIAKTIAFLEGLPADKFVGSEDRVITLKIGGTDMPFPGKMFLLNFSHPNFYFHVSIAHGILRHNGVEVGKGDFLGAA